VIHSEFQSTRGATYDTQKLTDAAAFAPSFHLPSERWNVGNNIPWIDSSMTLLLFVGLKLIATTATKFDYAIYQITSDPFALIDTEYESENLPPFEEDLKMTFQSFSMMATEASTPNTAVSTNSPTRK
jgi:hypothetical protein